MLTCVTDSCAHLKIFHNAFCPVLSTDLFDSDVNYLVMDYLVTNGYPAAAKRFAVEANIQPKADIESIQERVEIRGAIHSGDIQTAIEKINELSPQVRFFPIFPSFALSLCCYDYTSFMHHSYTLRGVDDKNSSSVLSMSNINVSLRTFHHSSCVI